MSCKSCNDMSPAYVTEIEDVTLVSKANGGVRTTVVTLPRHLNLSFGAKSLLVGLRIKSPDANFGITLKWQWSLDGKNWKTGSTVIVEKSSADDYTGILNATSELTPHGRLIAEVRDTTGATQVAAQISIWNQYAYI